MKYDIITFGSAVLDAFVRSPDIQIEKSVKSFTGQALVIPYGVKSEVEELTICSGGGGTNTAVGFARLGLKAAVAARCGWDFAGNIIREEIKKEGVDDEFFAQIEGERTDYSTVLIGPDGNRTILVYRGGTRLEKSMVDWQNMKAKWFYASSLEGNLDLLEKLVEFARNNQIKIAINPGRKELSQEEKLLEIVKKADVFIVNREEAARLMNLTIEDRDIFGKICLVLPGAAVVVTDGVNGVSTCLPASSAGKPGKGRLVMESMRVKMVDATGAGDGFSSGLITGLIKGWEIEKALRLGVSNGAAAVTEVGAKAGLIKEEEIGSRLNMKLNCHWEK